MSLELLDLDTGKETKFFTVIAIQVGFGSSALEEDMHKEAALTWICSEFVPQDIFKLILLEFFKWTIHKILWTTFIIA